MSGNRIDGGRLFQSLGPATWKALSPSLVWVRGTWQVMSSAAFCTYCISRRNKLSVIPYSSELQ